MQLPAPKTDFIDLHDDVTHLATGGQPPLLRAHADAFASFAADKARGTPGYGHHQEVGLAAKRALARLTHLSATDHAFIGSASEGIARVMSSFDWRPGDNVVVADKDYASGRFAMLRLAALGVEPRVVKSESWYIDPERLVAACDQRTRLLYVSQVTSLTGQAFDVPGLSSALEQRGVPLLVDASHALGVIPVDARLADFTVSSCYKYLCATHMGILAWNRERQPGFNPMSIGWASAADSADGQSYALHDDASRAQAGNPNHLDVYILERSLAYLLGYGIEAIEGHVRALSTRLHDGLVDLGLPVVTPSSPQERAGNIAFANTNDTRIVEQAAQERIYLWDGGGRVRSSVHLFNSDADVDRYLAWLRDSTLTG